MESKSLPLAYNIRRKSFKQGPGMPAPKGEAAADSLVSAQDIAEAIMAKLAPSEPVEAKTELDDSELLFGDVDVDDEEPAPQAAKPDGRAMIRGIMASVLKLPGSTSSEQP